MATAQFGVEPEEIFFRVAFAATATMAATSWRGFSSRRRAWTT